MGSGLRVIGGCWWVVAGGWLVVGDGKCGCRWLVEDGGLWLVGGWWEIMYKIPPKGYF